MRPIALLTDFGLADHYVGVLHAVLEREAPGAVAWYGAPRPARRVRSYGEAAPGEIVLLEGSSGLLELAANSASAAALTGLHRGDTVEITSDG